MAHNFTADSNDSIAVTENSALNDNNAWSMLWWFNFNGSFNTFGSLAGKGNTNKIVVAFSLNLSNGIDTIQYTTGTNLSQRIGGLSIVDDGWNFMVVTVNIANGPGDVVNIYVGNETTSAQLEGTDGTATGNSNEGAYDYHIGNSKGGIAFGLGGDIDTYMYWDREITLEEVQEQQYRPYHTDQLIYLKPGLHGATNCPDFSGNGNNGTGSGTTVADPVPLPPPFGFGSIVPFVGIPVPKVTDLRPYGAPGMPHIFLDKTTGLAILKIINETGQISESLLRKMLMSRVVDETGQVAEGALRYRDLARILSETTNLSEAVLRLMAMTRQVDETGQVTETVVRRSALTRVIDETIQIAEGALRFLGFVRVVDETAQITEGVLKFIGFIRVVDETIQVAEGVLRFLGLSRVINETIQISEGVLRNRTLVRILSGSLSVVEAALRSRVLARILNETVQISEQSISARVLNRIISSTVQVSEAALRITGLIRIVNETIQVAEGAVKLVTVALAIIVDAVPRMFTWDTQPRVFTWDTSIKTFVKDTLVRIFKPK